MTACPIFTAFGVSEWMQTVSARTGQRPAAQSGQGPVAHCRHRTACGELRRHGRMFTRDDQLALVVIVQICEEFGQEAHAAPRVDLFMQCSGNAGDRNVIHRRGIGDGLGNMFLTGRHAVERAVRLQMAERHSLEFQKCDERTDLVENDVGQLVTLDLHLASTEPGQIGQRDMRTHLDPVLLGQGDRLSHVVGVGAVKAAGHVGLGNEGHDACVVAHPVKAKALAHVTVDVHPHGVSS